jgi:hypothetical protein
MSKDKFKLQLMEYDDNKLNLFREKMSFLNLSSSLQQFFLSGTVFKVTKKESLYFYRLPRENLTRIQTKLVF